MESEDYNNLTGIQKRLAIQKRIDAMLLNDRFESPMSSISPASDMNDSVNAQEFTKDTSAIGFIMRLGYEDIIHIAWSKQKNKVVVYKSCC